MRSTLLLLIYGSLLFFTSCDLSTSEPHGTKCFFNVDDSKFTVNGTTRYQYDYVFKGDSIVEVKVKDGSGVIQKDLAFRYNTSFQLMRVFDKITGTNEATFTYQADKKWKTVTFANQLTDSAFYNTAGLLDEVREYNADKVLVKKLQYVFETGTTTSGTPGKNVARVTITTINPATSEVTTEVMDLTYAGYRDFYNLYNGFFQNLLQRIMPEESFMFTAFSFLPTNYNLATVIKRKITYPDDTQATTTDSVTYLFTTDLSLPVSVRLKRGSTSLEASWANVCAQF